MAQEGAVEAKPVNARAALMLLLAINLFNYIDRQVLAAVEPEIRKELLQGAAEDQAKFRMGLLSTAFLITYMLLAPVFGWLAGRVSRWWIIGIGVILWSVASGGSGVDWPVGIAAAYWMLFLNRCLVGVGEGAYGPIAPAMIADLYPIAKRGQVMAWFYLAIPVGGALGYAFGELVAGTLGWRWAFFLVMPPGILLGLLCFGMRDPPSGRGGFVLVPRSTWSTYIKLLKIPSYAFNTIGMTAMTFAIGGLAFWMPAFLDQREVPGPARTIFGAITATAGLFATFAGGMLGDYLRRWVSGSYFLVSGIALLVGFPMVLGVIYVPFPYAWIFVFFAVFCLFFNTGPTNTILANVVHPSIRASAFALNILIIHALGDAISPPIIGAIADSASLDLGFIVVSLAMLVGGVSWLLGMRFLERDTLRAEEAW